MSTQPSRPTWTPTGATDRKCLNCEAHHTKEYIRNFGKDGRLYHCHECLTHSDMRSGAGYMPEYDPQIHRRRHSASDHHPIFNGGGNDE